MSCTVDHRDDDQSDGSRAMGRRTARLEDKLATPVHREKESMLSYYPENEIKLCDLQSMAGTLKDVDLVSTKSPSSTGSMEVTLDVEEDLEAYLEEFSRLTRKGKFNTAIQLFHACPLHLKDHPEFILDFLDTLLKQGAYQTLVDFNADKEQFLQVQLRECGIIPIYYLRSVFELGRHYLFGFPESGLGRDVGADEVWSELLSNLEKLDSIQVQLLCNLIQLDSEREKFTKPPQNSPRKLGTIMDSSLNWHGLYTHLLSTSRIWDMRDLFHALCSRFGVGDAIKLLFKTPKQVLPCTGLNLDDVYLKGWFHFVLDWTQCSHGDESTDLALLDLLVTISLQLLSHGNENKEPIKKIVNQAMAHANQFAISLSLRNSENVHASPYLRWVLANQRLARELPVTSRQTPHYEYLKRLGGVVVWTCNLPIYVPFDTFHHREPTWKKQSRKMSDNLLQLGLSASRKNDDYSLGVQYLEEMFYTSDSPLDVLNELSHLQRDVQGDNTGYLRTCLTKYLCVADKPAMEDLSNELKRFDQRNPASHSPAGSVDAITSWGQRGIQSALCHHLGCPTPTSAFLEEKERAYERLPYDFKRVLAELERTGEDGKERRFDPDDVDKPLPKRFAEPCRGALHRDGNFIICDASGYFTSISPAPDANLEGGTDA